MMTRHSSMFRLFAILAVLVGAGLVPYVASSASNDWTTSSPFRVLDTRPGQLTIDNRFAGGGQLAAGSTLELQLTGRAGITAGAATVVLNLTTTAATGTGHITVHPCGSPRPNASNLNFASGATQANLVFARLDDQGRACIYASASTHLIADVQSYTTQTVTRIEPTRVLDSRPGHATIDGDFASIGERPSGSTLELQLTGRAGIPAGTDTVILNVTTTSASSSGYLTVHRCDRERPSTSNVNFDRGNARANLVVARLDGPGRTCIYTNATTHVVVDAQGYSTDPVTELGPVRLLDTRPGHMTDDHLYAGIGRQAAGSTLKLALAGRAGIPSDANTVVLNVTAANPSAAGYLTVHGCDDPRPNASNVNYTAHSARANVVVARIDQQGQTCIFTHASSNIIVDVQGYIVGATIAPTPQQVPPPTTTVPSTTVPSTTVPLHDGVGFVHPGVLVDHTQLEEIRANVAAGRQPWSSAFEKVQKSSYASLSYQAAPVAVVQAASSGNSSYLQSNGLENIGDIAHLDDARAAYTHALLWHATGNQAHADKAIEIMNAWSSTLTEIKFDQPRRTDNNGHIWSNGKLQAGWGGALFARAGEIIRYSNAGWSTTDIARFETMLHDVHLPLVITGWTNGANWLMTFSEATISIGVFTNDRATFDAGIDMWRQKAPSTIYHASDGELPQGPIPYYETPERMRALWYYPTSYISGLQGETLRDLSHMTMGLGALANTAETAYIQGIDLYGEQSARITAGLELQARFVNDYLDEVTRLGGTQPASTWTPPNWPGNAGTFTLGGTAYRSGWAIAHHHYTTRTGHTLPETTRLLQRLGPNAAQPALHLSWEPLTHGS